MKKLLILSIFSLLLTSTKLNSYADEELINVAKISLGTQNQGNFSLNDDKYDVVCHGTISPEYWVANEILTFGNPNVKIDRHIMGAPEVCRICKDKCLTRKEVKEEIKKLKKLIEPPEEVKEYAKKMKQKMKNQESNSSNSN